MNLKALKNIDYKQLAIKHCEKLAILISGSLLLMFVYQGARSGLSASSMRPEEIVKLAKEVTESVNKSQWNEAIARQQSVVNPDLSQDVERLKKPVDVEAYKWVQYFFHFVDFGAVLRQQPKVFAPEKLLASTDRGAAYLRIRGPDGNFVEEDLEAIAKRAEREKAEKSKKEQKGRAMPSRYPGSMGSAGMEAYERMMGGMMGEAGEEEMEEMAMGMAMGSNMASMGMGRYGSAMGMPTGGTASRLRRGRTRASNRRKERRFIDIEELTQPEGGAEGSEPAGRGGKRRSRKVFKEEVKGLRWVVVTALYPHGEQLQEFLRALHVPEHPEYLTVMAERCELRADETFSMWKPVNPKAIASITELVPRWEPEHRQLEPAIFDALVHKLPELAAGEWLPRSVDRIEALKAALDAGLRPAARTSTGGDYADGQQGSELMDEEMYGMEEEFSAEEYIGIGGPASGGMPGMASMPNMGSMAGGGSIPAAMRSTPPGPGGSGYPPPSGQPGSRQQTGQRKAKRSAKKTTTAKQIMVRFVDYTVEPGKTYRYRLKVVIKNPNHKRRDVADPTFAKAETLEGDWSEPSPPVYVPVDTEYYVLKGLPRESARMEVHKWQKGFGDWQVDKFPVQTGDLIGRVARAHEWVDFEDNLQKGPVDFSTDTLLVDVVGGDEKFSFGGATYTESIPAEVLIMDSFGDLEWRSAGLDSNNPDRSLRVENLDELKKSVKERNKSEEKSLARPGLEELEDFYERMPSRE